MMKRQNSLVPSSSSRCRRNSPEILLGKSTGCMSGVVTFLSKYLSPRKKRLTFSSFTKSQSSKEDDGFQTLSSYDSQKLPIIQIRRSGSPNFSTTLVARLMGLENLLPAVDSPETDEQKRRNVLRALEKCDEELKAVKKTIDTVSTGESLRSPALVMDRRSYTEDKKAAIASRSTSHFKDINLITSSSSKLQFEIKGPVAAHGREQERKKQREEDHFKLSILEKLKELGDPIIAPRHDNGVESPAVERRSGGKKKLGMKESVKEVCKDIAWGERREIGRIGLSLQHQICRDLVEEIVAEMGTKNCVHSYSLPFQVCRRRLRF